MTYMLLLNSERVAPLTTDIGSTGEDVNSNIEAGTNIESSMLCRWQGALVPVQVTNNLFRHYKSYLSYWCR